MGVSRPCGEVSKVGEVGEVGEVGSLVRSFNFLMPSPFFGPI